jgi:thiamine pyrophosphate-dependent acetolactate synthase large subunit-like protein
MVPSAHQLRQAADILNAREKVAMLVGAGAMNAIDEVLAVADALGVGVGKASVPDDVPYCTGSIGLLGTKSSWDMMQDADTLLMVGSSFPYSEFLPTTGAAKAVQIEAAFEADHPVIVDVLTTPNEPPMPPHVTLEQAKALMSSVVQAPSEGIAGAKEGVREMVHEFMYQEKG